MSNILKKLSILLFMVFVTSTSLVFVNATEVMQSLVDTNMSQNMLKMSDEQKDIYLPFARVSSNRIDIDKEILKPGLFFSKGSIDVTGRLMEPQFMFSGDTVRINAETNYSVIFASNVIVTSSINKFMVIFAENITFEDNSGISNDVICYANQINMKGNIDGSLIARASKIDIDGTIGSDLRIQTEKLTISDKSSISGKIYIETPDTSLNISDRFPQAEIVHIDYSKYVYRSVNMAEQVISGITTCLIFTLLYLIIQKASKERVFKSIVEKCKISPMYTVLTGMLSIILIPIILIILLIVTLLGFGVIAIPIFMILTVAFIVTILLSTFVIGSSVFEYIKNKYTAMFNNQLNIIVGSFVIYAVIYTLCRLPNIGWYVTVAVVFISLGVVFTGITKRIKRADEVITKDEIK